MATSFKTFVTGEVLTAANANTYLSQCAYVIKGANESVTSSTVIQADDHLAISCAVSSAYWLEALILYDGSSSGDLVWDWRIDNSSIGNQLGSNTLATTATDSSHDENFESSGINLIAGAVGTGTTLAYYASGYFATGATFFSGGQIVLLWAQNSSNGTATRVLQNSFMMITKVL